MGQDSFDIGSDIDEEDLTFLEKLSERPCLLAITSIIFVGYGIFGIVFDWLWVSDMLNVQEALVFGPPGDAIIACLITVATVGTIAFSFEVGNFVNKVKSGETLIPEDIAQIISLFVEEVPQITLNVLLASCREVPLSYYALVKAALSMFGGFFRATVMFFNYIQPRKKAKRRGLIPWLFRTIILAACVYNFIGACLVWAYTYTESDDAGFRPPDSLSKSYDSDRYLYKSGIFFSHPNFAECNNAEDGWEKDEKANWLELARIYDVTDADREKVYSTFTYNDNENYVYSVSPDAEPPLRYETCFHTDLTANCKISSEPAQNCLDAINDANDTIKFTFISLPRTKTIVFGDVTVNISYQGMDDVCEYPDIDKYGFLLLNNSIIAQIQYFRVRQDINDTMIQTFLQTGDGYRPYIYNTSSYVYDFAAQNEEKTESYSILQIFKEYIYGNDKGGPDLMNDVYDSGNDLLNVTAEWKTGYHRCDMTGSLRPNPKELYAEGDCGA